MADGVGAARRIGYAPVTTSPWKGPLARGRRSPARPATTADGEPGRRGADEAGSIDERRFRSILGRFATGVVAITAIEHETGTPTGLAANSFTSVSLDPPLVAFCVAHTSGTWPKLRKSERICVNVLAEPQQQVCLQLAAKGADKFADLGWTMSPSGLPVIDGALAWLECSVEAEHVAGDHDIIVARVHHLDKHHDGRPLIFFQGGYGSFEG
jgi:flavin reductase (DIM6/NTAB) family NADH-FMN oxidoreductase RutF